MNPRILGSLLKIFQRFPCAGSRGCSSFSWFFLGVGLPFLGKGLLPFPTKTGMEPKFHQNLLREGGNAPGSGISTGWAWIYGRSLRCRFLPFGMGFQAAPGWEGRKEGRGSRGIRGHRERPRIWDGEAWKNRLREICTGIFFPSLFPSFPCFFQFFFSMVFSMDR